MVCIFKDEDIETIIRKKAFQDVAIGQFFVLYASLFFFF
jgi:hypothetical protein